MEIKPTRVLMLALFSIFLGLILMDGSAAFFYEEDQTFLKEEMAWRADRDKRMRAPISWLTIAGLFWLEKGENSFGTSPQNKIKLPSGSAPLFAGKFIFNNGKISVSSAPRVELKVGDKIIDQMVLKGDDSGKPDIVELNDLRMWVIKRGTRYAILLRNLNNPPCAYTPYATCPLPPPQNYLKVRIEAGEKKYPGGHH